MNRTAENQNVFGESNKLYVQDRAVHEWYRFVLSFPAHLVRNYLVRFNLNSSHVVLDPFCGTGTVLVECKKQGISGVGIEANPVAHFATRVKIDWHPAPDKLIEHARMVANEALEMLRQDGIEDDALWSFMQHEPRDLRTLSKEETKLLLDKSISPLPLHKTLVLLECLRKHFHEDYSQHEFLAFSKSVVASVSNLHFGPEVGIGTIKLDVSVVSIWLHAVQEMAEDLRHLGNRENNVSARVFSGDAREISQILPPRSVDAVITSPPYPNEKDYTRTTRLESVLLGFIHTKADLQAVKKELLCSNTRTVYKGDTDDAWSKEYSEVRILAEAIEAERIRLEKTSGFERLYAKVTRLYFGGMARHLAFLRATLRPGAQLAYVVGDQASYFRIKIPTGKILGEIGQSLGYELLDRELFRTRFSTVTKEALREEVVIFRWPTEDRSFAHPLGRANQVCKSIGSRTMGTPSEEEHSDQEAVEAQSQSKNDSEEGIIELSSPSPKKLNRYQRLVAYIFDAKYKEGDTEVLFEREDLELAAQALKIKLPKNLGDVIYSFRYRTTLPESIRARAPEDKEWTMSPSGRSRYCFVAKSVLHVLPNPLMAVIKIPDGTSGIVAGYTQGDEQAVLTKLRYNRLVDIFTGVTCYSLQNHLRTTVEGIGQVETDEIYVGVDRNGVHYIFPLQAKGGNDKIGVTQIEQDIALCGAKFPNLVCRPLAAQFIEGDRIALFEFSQDEEGVRLYREAHYKLIPQEMFTEEDLKHYRMKAGDAASE